MYQLTLLFVCLKEENEADFKKIVAENLVVELPRRERIRKYATHIWGVALCTVYLYLPNFDLFL